MRIAFWTLLDCTISLLLAYIYCHYSWKELIFTPLCASYYHQIPTAHLLSCLWIWFPTSLKCYHLPAKGEGKKEKEIINTRFRFQAGLHSISVVRLDRDAAWRIHGDSGSAVPLSQKKPRHLIPHWADGLNSKPLCLFSSLSPHLGFYHT